MFFNAGFFNFFYNRIFVISFKFFYNVNVKYIEKGFFELLGPTGIYIFIRDFSYRLRFLSPFFINLSLLLIYISIVLFITYILLIYLFSISTIYILSLLFYIIG